MKTPNMRYSRLFAAATFQQLLCWSSVLATYQSPDLLDATLEDLRTGLDAGHFTSVDLVNTYLARIKETDDALNAVLEINPDALKIAAEHDAMIQARHPHLDAMLQARHAPLLGIPVLLKDNIATCDSMNTTAGSYALLGAKVPTDSTVVRKLREAGAVILGKTNLDQWAGFRGVNVSTGWSAVGGQTIGGYFPGHNPSGSSGGSAVAASLGLAWAALGTETGGSIIHPAHVNNVVGIKPTVGLTSRRLVVPRTLRQDTVGPLARTVRDAATLLGVIAGRDPADNATSGIPWTEKPDYAGACSVDGLAGKRIGVPRGVLKPGDPTGFAALAVFNQTLDILRDAGADVIDNIVLPGFNSSELFDERAAILSFAEFHRDLPEYLNSLSHNPNNITTVAAIRDFMQNYPLEGYPERDIRVWDALVNSTTTVSDPEYLAAKASLDGLLGDNSFPGAFKNYSLDALVVPSPWSTIPTAHLGWPAISVPMGAAPANWTAKASPLMTTNVTGTNQPFGLSFVGLPWSEEGLIAMACGYEARTRVRERVKPIVKPRTELRDVVGEGCKRR